MAAKFATETAAKFWTSLLVWAIGIDLFLGLMYITSPREGTGLLAGLVTWGGMSLILAAFPAGLVASKLVLGEEFDWKRWLAFGVIAASVSVALFVLAGWIGPAILSNVVGPEDAAHPAVLSLGELRGALREALDEARALGPTASRDDWFRANQLAFHYFSRVDGSILPFLFAWFGVFVGFWLRLVQRKQLRLAQVWAIGILLVITTYLAGENSYEMIVLRSAGFAGFAADIRLIVPMVMVAVLGWPTFLSLWSRSQQA